MKRIQFKDRAEVEAKVKALFPRPRFVGPAWVYWDTKNSEVLVELDEGGLSSEQLARLEDLFSDDYTIYCVSNYDDPSSLEVCFKCECPSE